MEVEPSVFVVDDDRAIREALHSLVSTVGLDTESYASFPDFLDAYNGNRPGCLVLDVRMPEIGGLEAMEVLKARGIAIPVIVITAYGDVSTAVRAMKAGVVDFFEKPFDNQKMLDTIQRSILDHVKSRQDAAWREEVLVRLEHLTPRERDVLDLVIAGNTNKTIAARLGIGRRTVEAHRARMMHKMRAKTVQTLQRIVEST